MLFSRKFNVMRLLRSIALGEYFLWMFLSIRADQAGRCKPLFGSGSAWIPYALIGSPGSGSVLEMRIRIQEQGNWKKTKNWFPAFQNGFWTYVGTVCFMRCYLYIKHIFNVKIQLFVMAKCDQDPDPHWFWTLDHALSLAMDITFDTFTPRTVIGISPGIKDTKCICIPYRTFSSTLLLYCSVLSIH